MLKTSPLAPASYPTLPPIAGVRMATCEAGIRYAGREDVLLVELAEGTAVAGVYTRSLTAAAPVDWCRRIGEAGSARALLVNSGNANAFTGQKGTDSVIASADFVARALGCEADSVFIASTGVIGEALPHEKFGEVVSDLVQNLESSSDHWANAAAAIMTTDTYPKALTRTATIDGETVTLNAIAKGSGMIAPDMATMLSFIFTDANISAKALQSLLKRSTDTSFNSITVDSDTSTNDTVLLFATGKAGHAPIEQASDPRLADFRRALNEIMLEAAHQIVRDGEGATKFVTINVQGAENTAAARKIALAIGNSPLVKTALAGEDPNWGRIVMAVGKSGEWANRDRLKIQIGEEIAALEGELNPDYVEANAAEHMKGENIHICVDVGVGSEEATIWTCDLTHAYIDINADYRS